MPYMATTHNKCKCIPSTFEWMTDGDVSFDGQCQGAIDAANQSDVYGGQDVGEHDALVELIELVTEVGQRVENEGATNVNLQKMCVAYE